MSNSVLAALAADEELVVAPTVELAELTTLRLGGPAAGYVAALTTAAAVRAITALADAGTAVLVVGGGSNLVVADAGFDGVVLHLRNAEISLITGVDGVAIVRAGAGAPWREVVEWSLERGLGGIECLAGIPGSAGATPVQNVGAYGVEISQVLHRALLFERATGTHRWVTPADLQLGYRTSRLKRHRFDGELGDVVLEVELALTTDGLSAPIRYAELAAKLGVAPDDRVAVGAAAAAVLELRTGKGMVLDPDDPDTYSAGSFFTNPVIEPARWDEVRARIVAATGVDPTAHRGADGHKLSAAWLISRAGFERGFTVTDDARVGLSTKHSLALTNRGGGTTAELMVLAATVRAGVRAAFGVELEPEPVLVGTTIAAGATV